MSKEKKQWFLIYGTREEAIQALQSRADEHVVTAVRRSPAASKKRPARVAKTKKAKARRR